MGANETVAKIILKMAGWSKEPKRIGIGILDSEQKQANTNMGT
jgi:hypothetical protein